MLTAESTRRQDLERQVELCVKIAGLGFGPEMMRLALERQGVPPAAARRLIGDVAAFFWFGLIAIGGGLALGWIVGFEYGTASGLDSMVCALGSLFQR